mgnify:CR=1 FL=1
MAKISIQYDNGRPDEVHDVAQFILLHVPPTGKEENLIMTAQCSNEFMRSAISNETAREAFRQSFKAMSKKRLGERP